MSDEPSRDNASPDARRIGVDTGGTFTDVLLSGPDGVLAHKVPSTPPDYAEGVLAGIDGALERAGAAGPFDLVHATTVATNALLERRGARVGLVATAGFRDVLAVGRQQRAALYALEPARPEPLVPRDRRREVAERVSAAGEILAPLADAEIERVLDALERRGVRSVAVSLLFSFLRPEHEKRIADAAERRGLTVSASSRVCPEFREYERTSTTAANAYVAPVLDAYLGRVEAGARQRGARSMRVVHSGGGSLSPRAAGEQAVRTLLSGPAAGVMAGKRIAAAAGDGARAPDALTFDMGGTSTDVGLVAGGEAAVTTEGRVGGLPVAVPMMDLHTVGAGGGSIARLDAGGALRVGPASAGADPGPACYGRGRDPTVTDAQLLLGRIDPERFLGGRLTLDPERARRALEPLAAAMGTGTEAAAGAIVATADAAMERALRVISVERGHDPRDFTLVCFGGAGGLHACALADALRIPRVLVPHRPGVLSAWGAAGADVVKDAARTVMRPAGAEDDASLAERFRPLEQQLAAAMAEEGFAPEAVILRRAIDARYAGQSFELAVPFDGRLADALDAFHERHAARFGHSAPAERVELVTLRVEAIGPVPAPEPPRIPSGGPDASAAALPASAGAARYDRARLAAGNRIAGPALVLEAFSTAFVADGWHGVVDGIGNLVLEPGSSPSP